MHTIMVVVGGLLLLGVCLLAGRAFGGSTPSAVANAAVYFIPLWLIVALINMWIGGQQGRVYSGPGAPDPDRRFCHSGGRRAIHPVDALAPLASCEKVGIVGGS